MEQDLDMPSDHETLEPTDGAEGASLKTSLDASADAGAVNSADDGDDLSHAKAALARAKKSRQKTASAKDVAATDLKADAKRGSKRASGKSSKKSKRNSGESKDGEELAVDLEDLVAAGVEVPATRDRFSDAGSDLDHVPGLHGESFADGVGQRLEWNAASLDFVEYEAAIESELKIEKMDQDDDLSASDLIARELGHSVQADEDEAIEQTLESSEMIARELGDSRAGIRAGGDEIATNGIDETLHLPSMEQMGFTTLHEDENPGPLPDLAPEHRLGDTPNSINDEAFAAAGSMDELMLASRAIASDFGHLAGESFDDGQFEFPREDIDAAQAGDATNGEPSEGTLAHAATRDAAITSDSAAADANRVDADATIDDGGSNGEDGEDVDNVDHVDDPADDDADPQATEFIEADHVISIIESLLFSTEKPVSIATIKQIFKGTNVRTKDITRALDLLASDYASSTRGVTLEEINGGFQLRTKVDNSEYLRRLQKTRPFRLSGPALEVMSIVAYKQPVTKHEIDEIRGVESGHLLRALMERGMVNFAGKSDLPGKPMAYGTTRKFLETFGLRNLKELPTLSEIDEILPQGIGDVEEKEKLSDITGQLTNDMMPMSYSEGEDELEQINDDLLAIDTTSEFFEQEKVRERERRDRDRAQDTREKIMMGDSVDEKERRWLDRYEAKLHAIETAAASGTPMTIANEDGDVAPQIASELEALSVDGNEPADSSTQQSADRPTYERSDAELIDNLNTGADEAESEEADLLDDLEANLDWDDEQESDRDHSETDTTSDQGSESEL